MKKEHLWNYLCFHPHLNIFQSFSILQKGSQGNQPNLLKRFKPREFYWATSTRWSRGCPEVVPCVSAWCLRRKVGIVLWKRIPKCTNSKCLGLNSFRLGLIHSTLIQPPHLHKTKKTTFSTAQRLHPLHCVKHVAPRQGPTFVPKASTHPGLGAPKCRSSRKIVCIWPLQPQNTAKGNSKLYD